MDKLLLFAGGGVLLYYLFVNRTSSPPAAASTEPLIPIAPNTKQLVADAAARAGYAPGTLLNGDQWNYFYQQVRGVAAPAPDGLWPNRPREFQMSIDEWWAGVSQAGVSGFRISPGFARQIG